MRAAAVVRSALSVAELTALNQLLRGTGTVDAFERELVTRVYTGALEWVDEVGAHELTRDQRRRWNAAVRYVDRFVPRGGIAMTFRPLRALNQSRDLLEDHRVLKTAIVAAAARGPVTSPSRRSVGALQPVPAHHADAHRADAQLWAPGV